MLDQVGAVLVVVIVGDIEPHFMHLGGPAQQLGVDVVFHFPGFCDLLQSMQRLALNASGLFQVDMVAIHQRAERAFAHVFMVMAAQQVIQHAFTQRAFAVIHALEFEGVEDRLQNRQAGREDRAAVGLDAVKVDFLDVAQLEQLALEPRQTFGVDFARSIAVGLERLTDGPNGAGRADGFIPLQAVQSVFDAHDLQACCGVRLGITGRRDLAVLEVALGEAHAAHLQAFAQQRLEALTNDELGTAAADIGHQTLARRVGQGVRDAEIDQARFLATGNDFHGMAEDCFGAMDEFVAIAGLAQGVGADDAHGAERQAVDQLGEALEAIEPALHGLFVERAFFSDACSQLNLFTQALKYADLALIRLGNDHVKAVGTQVDRCNQGKILGFGVRHDQNLVR
ncbi:hypothetical protein ALQ04_05436 [Pseudomonas cichorii]|uniref:Uncharacterized protein n=1 Tax=Pseudomonas cichorii TaxID=36746 RepID=A0A3M4LX76_PSECI|nr:hypothetical protein ALQ04_05436 [Pseudomonas cichorii]